MKLLNNPCWIFSARSSATWANAPVLINTMNKKNNPCTLFLIALPDTILTIIEYYFTKYFSVHACVGPCTRNKYSPADTGGMDTDTFDSTTLCSPLTSTLP